MKYDKESILLAAAKKNPIHHPPPRKLPIAK